MTRRRTPHRPFDAGLAEGFLDGRTIRAHELLTDGACNTNFKITLEDGSEYVLRLYARGSPGVERRAMELVRDAVPVPEILDSGPDWALMRFLPGVALRVSPEAALADLGSHVEFLTSEHDDAFKQKCVERVHALLRT